MAIVPNKAGPGKVDVHIPSKLENIETTLKKIEENTRPAE